MTEIGQVFLARRQEMELSLSALSKMIGGSPNESFIAKIERGDVTPSLSTAERLAKGLNLPRDIVINAAGHATDDQVISAASKLIDLVGSPHPVLRSVILRSAEVKRGAIGRRQIMLHPAAEAFVINFEDTLNEPYCGEAVVITNRVPANKQPVAVEIDGLISAWTYNAEAEPWIENAYERRATGFTVLGVIIQVTRMTKFD